MQGRSLESGRLLHKLDAVVRLLQDLFILEAGKAGMTQEEIRKILAIDKLRVTRITKHLKKRAEPE